MELDKSTKLEIAQRFISDLLQKLSQDPDIQIDAFEWGQKEIQYATVVYPLTVILDGQLRTLNFAEEEEELMYEQDNSKIFGNLILRFLIKVSKEA